MPAHRRSARAPGTVIARRLALGVLCVSTAGAAAVGITMHPPAGPADGPTAAQLAAAAGLDVDRANALNRANRDLIRVPPTPTATPTPAPSPSAAPVPRSTATPRPAPVPTRTPPARPDPLTAPLPRIAGLDAGQVRNAWAVVLEGHRLGISPRGQIIAMATALQESRLINYTHAVDHDSLGLFQQRPSMGWGTRGEITDPLYASRAFYRVLVRFKRSWGCLTCAAQDVQRSAYPGAYARHEHFATEIVTVLNRRFQT